MDDNKIIVDKDLEQKLSVFINTFNSLHDIKISGDEIKVGDIVGNTVQYRTDTFF
jgi:hypothetical protein